MDITGRKSRGELVFPHLGFERGPAALAYLGSLLTLADLAGFLIKTALPNLGEYPIFLDRFLEALQDALELLSLFRYDLRHTRSPFFSQYLSYDSRAS